MISPDPIHACWEGSQVIDSDFVWPAQYLQCLREVLCDPMFGDTGDPMFGDTGDPTCFLCGRCSILDGSEKFLVYTFCLCGRCNILETSEKVTVRGGENCDKRNVFDKRNFVVESMGCRGEKNLDKRKSGRVADDPW